MPADTTVPSDAYERISATATGVAYSRTFSDIPYSTETYEFAGGAVAPKDETMYRDLAPYFEARFKALSNAIQETGIKNILEMASGLGPRGYLFAADPSITYLETDLAEMVERKIRLLARLPRTWDRRGVHRASAMNALDESAFRQMTSLFPRGPLVIAGEGLLAYFTMDEKAALARIVHKILKERGGVWLTPDLNTQDNIDQLVGARSQAAMKNLKEETGRDYVANAFASRKDAETFYRDLGFSTKCRTIGMLAGPLKSSELGIPAAQVRAQLSVLLWEFRAM